MYKTLINILLSYRLQKAVHLIAEQLSPVKVDYMEPQLDSVFLKFPCMFLS